MVQPTNEHESSWADGWVEQNVCHVGLMVAATPAADASNPVSTAARGLFRDGDLLVIRGEDCQFPSRCIKTNESAVAWRPISLDFHVFAVTNRSYRFTVPLGKRWARKAERAKWNRWLGLAGIAMVFVSSGLLIADYGWALVVFFAGFVALAAGWIREKIGDRGLLDVDAVNESYIWLRGAGRPFLQSLPAFGEVEPVAHTSVVTPADSNAQPANQETQFKQQIKYDAANWPTFLQAWVAALSVTWLTGVTYAQLAALESGAITIALLWWPIAYCYYVLGTKLTVGLLVSCSLLLFAVAVFETLKAIASLVKRQCQRKSESG